jgi:hypothetical protein
LAPPGPAGAARRRRATLELARDFLRIRSRKEQEALCALAPGARRPARARRGPARAGRGRVSRWPRRRSPRRPLFPRAASPRRTPTALLLAAAAAAAALAAPAPAPALAEPGPVGRWLMAEPASLWELGMTRLQDLLLNGLPAGHPLAGLWRNASYGWDEDTIYVSAASQEGYGAARCSRLLDGLRDLAGVEGGRPRNAESSLFANQFARGFSTVGEPAGYTRRLDGIVALRVDMDGGSCRGRLLAEEAVGPARPRLFGVAGAAAPQPAPGRAGEAEPPGADPTPPRDGAGRASASAR